MLSHYPFLIAEVALALDTPYVHPSNNKQFPDQQKAMDERMDENITV